MLLLLCLNIVFISVSDSFTNSEAKTEVFEDTESEKEEKEEKKEKEEYYIMGESPFLTKTNNKLKYAHLNEFPYTFYMEVSSPPPEIIG